MFDVIDFIRIYMNDILQLIEIMVSLAILNEIKISKIKQ